MEKRLVILEVSQKQAYIFKSNKLMENVLRSAEINAVTGSEFFAKAAPEIYREEQNMIYSGGGHTVLQFDNEQQATDFARQVTERALQDYPELELFVKQIAYCPEKTPGENLKALSAALEAKKAVRHSSFRQLSIGVEAVPEERERGSSDPVMAPDGCRFFCKPEELSGDNFLAVVHIDGNGMGKRVNAIYEAETDWESCCRKLRRFSEGIQKDFTAAFAAVVEAVKPYAVEQKDEKELLPIRPVILAGDDVCFLTAGKLGLECARIFLETLGGMENCEQPGKPYAACAGVAMVHLKYPFHRAYDLSEELCSSAKCFGAALDPEGGVSAMDWHIEFGQLKDSLSEIREDYQTEDGQSLTLRPVAVKVPEGISTEKLGEVRTYSFFRGMCLAMKGEYGKVARSKIKELRTALKQGEVEARFFLQDKQVGDFLYHVFDAKYQSAGEKMEQYRKMVSAKSYTEKQAFVSVSEENSKRCLFFDAIEMIDHFEKMEEGAQ